MGLILGALLLAAGGLLSISVALAIAATPYGDTALVRFLRPGEVLATVPRPPHDLNPMIGLLAIPSAISGALLLLGGPSRRSGRPGQLGVGLLAIAFVGFLGAYAVYTFPFVPIGFFGLLLGNALIGVAALRGGFLPRAEALLLIAVGVLLLFFNSEDDRALVFVPVGVIWIWVAFQGFRTSDRARVRSMR